MRVSIPTPDGVTLIADHIFPPPSSGPARGVVWLGHAILANRRSLDRPAGGGLASELAAAGLHVYSVDVRGHGESHLLNGAGWRYDDLLRLDFPAVRAAIRARHPGLRVAVLGHSLVGHAAAAWIGTSPRDAPPVDALVTLAANVWLPRLEPSRPRWARKAAVLALLGGLVRVFGRVPARAVRFGSEDAPATFVEDWLAWAHADRWTSRSGVDYLAALGNVRVPVLAAFGAGDGLLCHPLCGEMFHRRLSAAPLEIHVAGRADLGYDPGHMTLVTDPRSRPLWRRIGRWLVEKLGGRPARA